MCLMVINRSNYCAKPFDAKFLHLQNSPVLSLYFLSTLNQILFLVKIRLLKQMSSLPAALHSPCLPACWLAQGDTLQTSANKTKPSTAPSSAAAHANRNYYSITGCSVKTSEPGEPGTCACVQEQRGRDGRCSLARPGAQKGKVQRASVTSPEKVSHQQQRPPRRMMFCWCCARFVFSLPSCKTADVSFAVNCVLGSDRPGNSDWNTRLGGSSQLHAVCINQ